MTNTKTQRLDWGNILLLALVHVVAVGGTSAYVMWHGLTLAATLIGLGLTGITIFCISAGYHRLLSHRAYEAHPLLRGFLLFFGAGAFQNSALTWAGDHRRHHASTDTALDPYDVSRGFWYSHIGWVLQRPDDQIKPMPVHDLEHDRLVRFQHDHYAWVGIAAGLVVPTLLGLIFGDPIGGFVIGAAVRLLVTYHMTFTINSLAHIVGARPYSRQSSARDSLLVALLSMGEGYHNYHHSFPADYRNGVGRFQYDPTKWILFLLSGLGIVRKLRRAPAAAIARAKTRARAERLAMG